MSLSPIPFTAIAEFVKLIDVGEFSDFLYFIRRLDDTYMLINGKDAPNDNSNENDKNKG